MAWRTWPQKRNDAVVLAVWPVAAGRRGAKREIGTDQQIQKHVEILAPKKVDHCERPELDDTSDDVAG